jgi:hypothetical protein
LAAEVGERGDMACCEVHDVNVVAHARPVWRGVVVAEHVDARAHVERDFGQNRNQVVRCRGGRLADLPAGMGACRIEVAQQADPPRSVRPRRILEDLLDHALGSPVDARRLERRFFGNRIALGLAVDGRR